MWSERIVTDIPHTGSFNNRSSVPTGFTTEGTSPCVVQVADSGDRPQRAIAAGEHCWLLINFGRHVSYPTFASSLRSPSRAILIHFDHSTESSMRNNKPKSEMPAMKEKAAKDKDKQARQKSIDKERIGQTRESGVFKKS